MRPVGSKNLRPEVIAEMRRLRSRGHTLRAIAALVGCDHTVVFYWTAGAVTASAWAKWLVHRGAGL